MSHVYMARKVMEALASLQIDGAIPVSIRPHATTGTVQDDPFDEWFCDTVKALMPDFEVIHSGPLTTPDVILRDRTTREIIGIEVKKVDEQHSGKDSRGLTLDYNSCIPCGQMQIKIGGRPSRIKTYYFFGLLSVDQARLVSSCLMDGDFLNYDFDLHLQGKYANTSQYGHGPYGEGSVRGRAMYNYPNPMNTALANFYRRHSLVINGEQGYQIQEQGTGLSLYAQIERQSIDGRNFLYHQYVAGPMLDVLRISDIFRLCRLRKEKKRTAYITDIAEHPAAYVPSAATGVL